ncbi:MAG: tRNA lysidine(34) synthetase TilS [bacterium]
MIGYSMLLQLKSTMESHRLLRGVKSVLVAVSGGADSVAVLHAMAGLSRSLGITVSVAHLNHRIRGRAADADAEFVRATARRLKLVCVTGRADVPGVARRKGISLEMAAREERYKFLRKAASKVGADCVVTAHTADDQAETILLRLIRGTGVTGLGGIRYRATIGGLVVIRPMLDVRKSDAIAYLRSIKAGWREDKSNSDMEFQRNRVRHELIPLLERTLNPAIRRALIQTGSILRDEDEWVESLAAAILRKCTEGRPAGRLSISALMRQPLAARRRVLRLWLAAGGMEPECMCFDAIGRVDAVARLKRGNSATCLPGGWQAARIDGDLELRRASRSAGKSAFRMAVKVPGETILPALGLKITVVVRPGIVRDRPSGPGQLPARASLNPDAMKGRRLYVRSWRAGDRLEPFGLHGSKKIQDVFVDAKVPRAARSTIPVFECGGRVVWLPGYRIDRGWAVEVESGPAVQVLVEAE